MIIAARTIVSIAKGINPLVYLCVLCAVPFLLFAAIWLVEVYLRGRRVLPTIPRVGQRDEFLAELKTRYRATVGFMDHLKDAYEKYLSKGQMCVMSTVDGELVLLPREYIQWVIDCPDNVLSADEAQRFDLQSEYTFTNSNIMRNRTHDAVIKSDLTRRLGDLIPDIADEINHALCTIWGTEKRQWSQVKVLDTVKQIVTRATNRAFVGAPLCRNPYILRYTSSFAIGVVLTSYILRLFPEVCRPIVAPLVTLSQRWVVHGVKNILKSEISTRERLLQEREELLGSKDLPNSFNPTEKEPEDFLQWMIRYARKRYPDRPWERSPSTLAGRINAVNFAAIHTSTMGMTDALLDIFSAPPEINCISELRAEAKSALASEHEVWTKKAMSMLHKCDSAIRESLRLNSFVTVGLTRYVVSKDGAILPDGTVVPFGTLVGVPTHLIHRDTEIYPDADKFDPFRFSRQREPAAEAVRPGSDTSAMLASAQLGMVTTSSTHLAFGHGRHACPGRFFATTELKLLLANILLQYDIEMLEERPKGHWVWKLYFPNEQATLRVRRID